MAMKNKQKVALEQFWASRKSGATTAISGRWKRFSSQAIASFQERPGMEAGILVGAIYLERHVFTV